MPDFKQSLDKLLRLVIGQDGYLKRSTDSAVQRVYISSEDYIDRRLTAGASPEQVFQELMDDMKAEESRIFGSFQTEMKGTVYGSANIASTNGTVAELISQMKPGERGTRLLRWQTNGTNICEDCLQRHGQEDTLDGWIARGLPGSFGSRCTVNCQCTLVATEVVLEPIMVEAV